jgi:hypothetical protein
MRGVHVLLVRPMTVLVGGVFFGDIRLTFVCVSALCSTFCVDAIWGRGGGGSVEIDFVLCCKYLSFRQRVGVLNHVLRMEIAIHSVGSWIMFSKKTAGKEIQGGIG